MLINMVNKFLIALENLFTHSFLYTTIMNVWLKSHMLYYHGVVFILIIWWFSSFQGKGWYNDEHYRDLLHHTGHQHLGKGNVSSGLIPYMGQQHRLVKAMTDASERTQQTAHSPQIPYTSHVPWQSPNVSHFILYLLWASHVSLLLLCTWTT